MKEFQKEMKKQKIGLCMFFNFDGDNLDPNMVYFTGYTGFGALAITPTRALLFVPKAEYVRAKKTSKVKVVVAEKRILASIKKTIKPRSTKVGVDKNRVTLNFYKALRANIPGRYMDVSGICQSRRAVKSAEEIRVIKKSCAIADEIMQKTFWHFREFESEAEVSAFMINEVHKRGLTVSFKPIIASGGNASEAHHEVDTSKLRKGFCVMDFGVKYKGYCSDITRTIYLGEPKKSEVDLYYEVLRVQEELISDCKVGASFVKIDEKARELFGSRAKYFTHLIGHGVGTEIHESPNPKQSYRRQITKLLEGSVITIEPGLYYDGVRGIRIEDDVLVTKSGPKVLTKTGKNLLVVREFGGNKKNKSVGNIKLK